MNRTVRCIKTGCPILAFAVFCLWLFAREDPLSAGIPFAALSLCLYTLILTTALIRLTEGKSEAETPASLPDTRREKLTAWGILLLFGIAVSVFEYGTAYVVCHPEESFLDSFESLYYRSDVAHYMGIARDWYVREGDERLRLVFLPLYPLTIRAFTFAGDYFQGAFLASQLFSMACLPAAYELFRLDMKRWDAMACARILLLFPGAAFLRIPMSEGLFLFVTLLAVYYGRKRKFLWACLFTALSALTRSLGILLLGFVFVEMLYAFGETYRQNRSAALGLALRYLMCLLLGCSGTFIYLMINRQISGSSFTFLTYQKENWTQQLGWFFNTAAYQVEYVLLYLEMRDWEAILSLSLPNLLCSFAALGLLYRDRHSMRISYLLWCILYFAAAIGATWLLSGPRYLAMLFPLAVVMQRLGKKPGRRFATEAFLLLCQTAYLLMLAWDLSVY